MTWAVTLDFHNTIAQCDDWFNLEVYDLIPAFFAWLEATSGAATDPARVAAGQAHYRKLRRRVIDTGIELDAASAVAAVVSALGVVASPALIERALEEIFQPTLCRTAALPGVVASVRSLKDAGLRLAVISSAAYHPFLEWTLAKFELAACFDEILTSASTGHYKSSTRIYETALELLAVQPHKCIHIGDSERFDVVPARDVGMRTVLVGAEAGHGSAHLELSTLVDLPQALHQAFGLPLAL